MTHLATFFLFPLLRSLLIVVLHHLRPRITISRPLLSMNEIFAVMRSPSSSASLEFESSWAQNSKNLTFLSAHKPNKSYQRPRSKLPSTYGAPPNPTIKLTVVRCKLSSFNSNKQNLECKIFFVEVYLFIFYFFMLSLNVFRTWWHQLFASFLLLSYLFLLAVRFSQTHALLITFLSVFVIKFIVGFATFFMPCCCCCLFIYYINFYYYDFICVTMNAITIIRRTIAFEERAAVVVFVVVVASAAKKGTFS